jgi:hypothetical protein
MPFPFVYVCDLLEDLGRLYDRVVPLLPKDLDHRTTEITLRWLKRHRDLLDTAATDDDCVILTLQPEKRTDRVYGLDAFSLEQIVARVLNLPKQHCKDLQAWRNEPVQGDLASCVERVMQNMATVGFFRSCPGLGHILRHILMAPPSAETLTDGGLQSKHRLAIKAKVYAVTVEKVDEALLQIASQNKDSSAEVRSLARGDGNDDTIDVLNDLYQRLTSREAKWLTRLILKTYSPVKFPDSLICQSNNSFLPRCVQVRAQFSSSMPVELRREGPGSLKLANTLKPADTILPTPPAAALQPLSSAADNLIRGTDNNSPGVNTAAEVLMTKGLLMKQVDPAIGDQTISKSLDLSSSPGFFKGRGICQLTGQTCPLSNCLFVLATSISTTPWLIESLLPWHGVSYVTSLKAFASCAIPNRCPQTGKRYRKIALVETRSPNEAAQFMKNIGKLNLQAPHGEKQWIEVYDWRILECIGKVDQGKELTYDPWQRCWIGAV